MQLRQILILITSIIIISLFIITGWKSYDFGYNRGLDYGEKNAESIRLKKKQNSYDTIINKNKSVNVIEVKNNFNKQSIECSGIVSSLQEIRKTVEVPGQLEGRLSLKKGRKFKKGEILFSINNREFSLYLESRRSKFSHLIASNLPDIKLDFPKEYEKWSNFLNKVSTNSNLPSLPKRNTEKEKMFIISKLIESEYKSIKSEEEKLKKYTIIAPWDGIILESYTDIGATVNPGTPIIDIVRDELMEIELFVNKSDIKKIEIGDLVELKEEDSTEDFFAKIIRKGNDINNNTQNISVFAQISPNENIRSGTFLNGMIFVSSNIETVNIPIRAIFGNNNNIWIVQGDTLVKKEIKIISYKNNTANITGVNDNTLIIPDPIVNAKEGMTVTAKIIKE